MFDATAAYANPASPVHDEIQRVSRLGLDASVEMLKYWRWVVKNKAPGAPKAATVDFTLIQAVTDAVGCVWVRRDTAYSKFTPITI